MIQLDLSYLEMISGGDQSFIKEMLTMFLNSTFTEISELKEHAVTGNWEKMGTTAHRMKAPLQMLGVTEVSNLIMELELMGKSKENTESAVQKVTVLEGYIKQLEADIRKVIEA